MFRGVFALLSLVACVGSGVTLTMSSTSNNQEYSLVRNGKQVLSGFAPRLHCDGEWGRMRFQSQYVGQGFDPLGRFEETVWTWVVGSNSTPWETSWRSYEAHPDVITFAQRFPAGATNTSLGDDFGVVENKLMSQWPRWGRSDVMPAWFGSITQWDDRMVGYGVAPPPGGLYGGNPLLLFDDADESFPGVVLSPLSHFSAGWQSDMAFGLHGRLRSVPSGFTGNFCFCFEF